MLFCLLWCYIFCIHKKECSWSSKFHLIFFCNSTVARNKQTTEWKTNKQTKLIKLCIWSSVLFLIFAGRWFFLFTVTMRMSPSFGNLIKDCFWHIAYLFIFRSWSPCITCRWKSWLCWNSVVMEYTTASKWENSVLHC